MHLRFATLAMLLAGTTALAQNEAPPSPLTIPEAGRCLRRGEPGLLELPSFSVPEGSKARLYFRAARSFLKPTASRDYYFVDMKTEATGTAWAVLPKPDPCTRAVDVYVEVKGKDGKSTQGEPQTLPLRGGCKKEWGTEQLAAKGTMVVGNTARDQNDHGVRGFREEGIVGRITDDGAQWPYTAKLTGSALPCWAPVALITTGSVAAGGIVISTLEDNPSPSRP